MEIIKQLKWRYATKKFNNNKLVSNDKIERISQAFNLTATSFGLQPLKLIIANNKQLQQELVKHSMNQEQVAQALSLIHI